MTGRPPAPHAVNDPATVLRQGLRGEGTGSGSHTSDLTIDELLAVHSVGYDALELVTGNASVSIPLGAWSMANGEITEASSAHHRAFELATSRMLDECSKARGDGVVGVDVHVRQVAHCVEVDLTGTAVRRVGATAPKSPPFASDLSGQDFALLVRTGWGPVGLALGVSYVHITRSSMGQVLGRVGQNTELTAMTEALYAAREAAMERMQSAAITLGGHGVVDVKVAEGPIGTFSRAVAFAAYGTAVALGAPAHLPLAPLPVVALDDPVQQFEATSLS